MSHPTIIQGGMGVAVSGWRLAHAVSQRGGLGVVSGTAMAVILARRLQLGDPDGSMRRALEHFPIPGVADRILERYYIAGGKPANQPFKTLPVPSAPLSRDLIELTVTSNFAEVFLAKEGHDGAVGVNYLEKIQIPMLASLFGAMLAGVNYVLMGAGVPRSIPGVLDAFSRGEPARLKVDVADAAAGEELVCTFDPREFCGRSLPAVKRPYFLAIVSSATLATALARKSSGKIDGFVVEGSTAGGHNAPPRGSAPLNERGEPIYGPQDTPDLPRIAALGLPFWLAGEYADPTKIAEALRTGATGVQVGTIFAFCEESGLGPDVKRRVLERVQAGKISIFTDPVASPTGFPFKVVELPGTLSQREVYESRERRCDLGYLRSSYRRPDGTIGYRCAGEPVEQYLKKGGTAQEAENRKCLCNGLLSAVGLGQVLTDGSEEPAILTAGDDLAKLRRFLPPQSLSYTADDVLQYLRGGAGAARLDLTAAPLIGT